MAALEREAIAKLATLESELAAVRAERDQLAEARRQVVEEVRRLLPAFWLLLDIELFQTKVICHIQSIQTC